MGTCTVTLNRRSGLRPTGQGVIATVNLSTSYATGGDTLPLSALGFRTGAIVLGGGATSPAGHAVEVVYGATESVNPLLRVRDAATGAEIANATNLSAQSVRVEVVGELGNP
jgi:hypothetical protein